jgi:hypothetical protein
MPACCSVRLYDRVADALRESGKVQLEGKIEVLEAAGVLECMI